MNKIHANHAFPQSPLQVRKAPGPGPTVPAESFSSGQPTPPWMARPNFEPPTPPQKSGIGKAALIGLGLAGGVAATLGVMQATQAPPVVVQMSQHQAQRGAEQFSYLQSVAGELRSEPQNLMQQMLDLEPKVDAPGAVQALSYGKTVYWYPNPEGEPLEIHNLDELRSLTTKVKFHMAGQQFQNALENLGQQLGDIFR